MQYEFEACYLFWAINHDPKFGKTIKCEMKLIRREVVILNFTNLQ